MKNNSKEITLLILAAGLGSRFGGLKQLAQIGSHGQTIADYSVFDGKRAGFNKFVFVINKNSEGVFREKIFDRMARQVFAEYVFQPAEVSVRTPSGKKTFTREKPFGTAHAALSAKSRISEDFAVINADDFYGRKTFKLLFDHLKSDAKNEGALAAFGLRGSLSEHGSVARGVCEISDAGYLTNIRETLDIKITDGLITAGNAVLSEQTLVSLNAWAFRRSFFDALNDGFERFLSNPDNLSGREYFLPNAVLSQIEQGALFKALKGGGPWFGLTYKEDLPACLNAVDAMRKEGVYPENLWG